MSDDRYPEILTDLAAKAAEVLEKDGGLARGAAEALARRLVEMVGIDWAGQQVYIGKGVAVSDRDREIYRQFTGTNHTQLAVRYRMSERQIYNIVRRIREEDFNKKQMSLFDE